MQLVKFHHTPVGYQGMNALHERCVIVIVITNQDSTSSRLLPGSSYSCCIRNLHALVHKQCHPVHITTVCNVVVVGLGENMGCSLNHVKNLFDVAFG
jgi:hypothetical protein